MPYIIFVTIGGCYVMTQEATVKISEGGRIVIPAEYRKKLGLEIGDELILRIDHQGQLKLLTHQQAIQQAQELIRKYVSKERSLSEELIAERRGEIYE
jgi:AbrB family looped-hinge helix DNA binding protein